MILKRFWVFTQLTSSQGERWTWSLVRIDGSIDKVSTDHADYGGAVIDALANGFRPNEEHYFIRSGTYGSWFMPADNLADRGASTPKEYIGALRASRL